LSRNDLQTDCNSDKHLSSLSFKLNSSAKF